VWVYTFITLLVSALQLVVYQKVRSLGPVQWEGVGGREWERESGRQEKGRRAASWKVETFICSCSLDLQTRLGWARLASYQILNLHSVVHIHNNLVGHCCTYMRFICINFTTTLSYRLQVTMTRNRLYDTLVFLVMWNTTCI